MFITKEKTNWLFLVAVAFIAGATGSALVSYINDTAWQAKYLLQ